MTMPVIDTHFHMWELERFHYLWPNNEKELEKIYRNFTAKDYQSEMEETPIRYSIFVEVCESIAETEWVLNMETSMVKGVVGFVDLTSSDVDAQVARLKQNPKFVGVRKVLDLSPEGWIERDDVMEGMKVLARHKLTYDLLVRGRNQWESAKRFLKRAPSDLRVVLNHLGKPNVKEGAVEQWFDDIITIASYPNVYCKLSGLVTEAHLENWKLSDFTKYVDHVIKYFGTDRVMFGSDWPVCKLANANLPDVYKLMSELLSDKSEEEKQKMFFDNAMRCYNLKL